LRRLRELYPDLNVKLFYARDFRALMLKYGKLALVEGLSGTSGQVAAPYGRPDGQADTAAVDALPPGSPIADAPPVHVRRRRHRIADQDLATKGPAIHS
jgi:hypothetical protein